MPNPTLKLYSRIMRQAWMIDPQEAEAYLPFVMQLITGQQVTMFDDEPIEENGESKFDVYAISSYETRKYGSYDEAPEGSVAVIPVQDVMDKDDYCGVPGTRTLQKRLEEALAHDNIIGVVLDMDTPGGSPYGTESFANAIASAEKPVVAWVDGIAASAGYWIASSADEVMLSGAISGVGSIGTYASLADYTKYFEEKGIKIWEVYASKSTDKNKAVRELIKNQNTKPLTAELDTLNEVFLTHVSTQRESTIDTESENVLSGSMYRGEHAIQSGLADSIGDFFDAVNRVAQLAEEQKTASTQANLSTKNSEMFNTKFKALSALAEKVKKGEEITQSDYDAVNAEFEAEHLNVVIMGAEAVQTQREALSTANAALLSAVQAVNPDAKEVGDTNVAQAITDALSAKDKEISTLNEKLNESEPPKPVSKGKEEKLEEEETENEYMTSADRILAELSK